MEEFKRTEMLFGRRAIARFAAARVAVFGIGGVGGHAAEALVRSGIGAVDLIDNDTVSLSNLNRQLFATRATVGMAKVDAARLRLAEIAPDCKVRTHALFYLPETADALDLSEYDYIIDAVDTVTAKIELAVRAHRAGVPIIASMGAGNKLDPTRFEVAELRYTSVCPLAKVMRKELKARGIERMKVVYSKEPAITPRGIAEEDGRRAPASCAFVPSVVGLILAGEVIKDLAREAED